MSRQRFLTARRRFMEGRLPLATIVVGPPSPRMELFSLAALHCDIVLTPANTAGLISALGAHPGGRLRRLVLFELGEPDYHALDAIRALRAVQGVHLVTWSLAPPHDAWAQVIRTGVEARMTPKELLAWTQIQLGGAPAVAADELLRRVGWDTEAAAAAARRVTLLVDKVGLADVRQYVAPDPELHFVDALVHCDKPRARELVTRVERAGDVVGRLEHRLLQLWALGEVRPPSKLASPRDITGWTGVEPDTISALAPLVRLYSRQKIAQRLEALAVVDRELQRGAGRTGLLETLCEIW